MREERVCRRKGKVAGVCVCVSEGRKEVKSVGKMKGKKEKKRTPNAEKN